VCREDSEWTSFVMDVELICCGRVGVHACSLDIRLGINLSDAHGFFISGVCVDVCVFFRLGPFSFLTSLSISSCDL